MTNGISFEEKQINEKLKSELEGWEYDGKWIRKTFKTHSWKNFDGN